MDRHVSKANISELTRLMNALRSRRCSMAMARCIHLELLVITLLAIIRYVSTKGDYVNTNFAIKTKSGWVRGVTRELPGMRNVETYLGIPYAKPPTENLRFKHPQQASSWTGVLDATKFGFSCHQFPYFRFDIPGVKNFDPRTPLSEDCLTLNVFVPHPKPSNSTVMVFIHGGGFSVGGSSASFHDGSVLAREENVIVVSMNYRVASFGFLALDHPEIDANCGLMDQLLALKWVRDNIAAFGGNPEDVTLFGQSAGAVSVGYHVMSPLSKGLFKRAIMESGTPLMQTLLQDKAENKRLAFQTGKNLKCPNLSSTGSLVRCLKAADPKKLIRSEPIRRLIAFVFGAVIDGHFIVEDPAIVFRSSSPPRVVNQVDIMSGVVKNEGSLFPSLMIPLVFLPIFDMVEPYYEEFLEVVRLLLPNQCESFYDSIQLLYTDWERFNSTSSNLNSADEYISEFVFKCPLDEFLEGYSSLLAPKLYSYYFPYRSPQSDFVKWVGTPHGEELRYLMSDVTTNDRYDKKDKDFGRRLLRYWANFARTGDPNKPPLESISELEWVTWPEYNQRRKNILILEPENDQLFRMSDVETKRCAFWKTRYPALKELHEKSKCPPRTN